MTRTLARVQPQVGARRGTIYTYVRSPLYCTVQSHSTVVAACELQRGVTAVRSAFPLALPGMSLAESDLESGESRGRTYSSW